MCSGMTGYSSLGTGEKANSRTASGLPQQMITVDTDGIFSHRTLWIEVFTYLTNANSVKLVNSLLAYIPNIKLWSLLEYCL